MIEENVYDGWIPLNKRHKISYMRMLAIASGNIIPKLIANLIFIFFVPKCKNLGISSFTQSMLLLTAALIEFFLVPFLGSFSDGLMIEFGRRRIFIIVGSILAFISLMLLYFSDVLGQNSNNESKKTIFITSLILSFLSINIIQTPARVLCSDLTPAKQQNLMSNICQFFGGLGPLVSNLVLGISPFEDSTNTRFILIFNISLIFIALTITCIAAREEPLRIKPEKVNVFEQMYSSFKKMPKPFSRIMLPFILSNIAIFQFQIQFTGFMVIEVLLSEPIIQAICFAALCLAVNNICQILYSLVNHFRVTFFGMKWTMVAGTSILTFCLFLFLFIKEKHFCMILAGLIGICQVIFNSIPYAIVSIVIPTEELGINFGILNSFCILGQQISNWGIGALVDVCASKNKESKKIAISSIFALFAAISSMYIIQPTIAENCDYNQIDDDVSDRDHFSELSID